MRFFSPLASLAVLATSALADSARRDTTAQAHAMLAVDIQIGDKIDNAYYDHFYETNHFPRIMALPGFLSNTRLDAIDGLIPNISTLYDLTSIQAVHSPEWDDFDKNRPEEELALIPLVERSDLLNYVEHGKPVGGVSGPSIVAQIQYTPASGAGDAVDKNWELFVVPFLKRIPGFQRARRYKLESFFYFTLKDRAPPAEQFAIIEFDMESGAFNSPTWKLIRHGLQTSHSLQSVKVRLYQTRKTWGPWA